MKKEYFVPEMEILELKYCKMLCASDDEPPYNGHGDPDDDSTWPD